MWGVEGAYSEREVVSRSSKYVSHKVRGDEGTNHNRALTGRSKCIGIRTTGIWLTHSTAPAQEHTHWAHHTHSTMSNKGKLEKRRYYQLRTWWPLRATVNLSEPNLFFGKFGPAGPLLPVILARQTKITAEEATVSQWLCSSLYPTGWNPSINTSPFN